MIERLDAWIRAQGMAKRDLFEWGRETERQRIREWADAEDKCFWAIAGYMMHLEPRDFGKHCGRQEIVRELRRVLDATVAQRPRSDV
jgi:hypothetical protein